MLTRIFLLSLFAAALAVAASSEQISTDSGKIQGAIAGNVAYWKGIPLAAPPVGQNRWQPPQPVAPWQDVKQATEYGADCMQKPFPGDAAPLGVPPAEDCLYLNVWAPAQRSHNLPVLVWIYGGGFVNGGSSPAVYDGSNFAESGIILVSFNYRLGRFGFFAHPALTKASAGEPLANYAFMDQIAALKWVQKNIAAFGGDPKNVTIFGESAGGHSVLTLMTSPEAKGLFQRAICESGGGRDLLGPVKHLSDAEQAGTAFAKQMGIDGNDQAALDALRALPADKIVSGLNMATMNAPTYSGPVVDGKIVVEPVQDAFRAKHEAKVPLIIGANSNEFGFGMPVRQNWDAIMKEFGERRPQAESAYDPEHKRDVNAAAPAIGSDRAMVEPARFVAREVRIDGEPAYEYRFSYVASSMRSQWPNGAPHATEIPFVFDTVKARYGDKLTEQDEKEAQQMHAYWVAFARNGNPEPSGLPKWPEYSASKDELMNFTLEGAKPMPDPVKARLDVIESMTHK